MAENKVALMATTKFLAPRSLLVVVKFDGRISSAINDDGSPFDYDLEDGECFVRYTLDENAPVLTRPLKDVPP